MDMTERNIYAQICQNDGIKARDIAKNIHVERSVVNHFLYASPYLRELCYQDDEHLWHGMIRQGRRHTGLGNFCGYYGLVQEFLQLSEEEWFRMMLEGCRNIGRNLNDTRGLFHSFKDTRQTMVNLFDDLEGVDYGEWEIVFELRIKRARYIRIYADVLLISPTHVFSLEFKMKDVIEKEEVAQAAKYCEYLEVLFGPQMDVIPVLVLTRTADLYRYEPLGNTSAEIVVCSGDMLFNVVDEYLGFLEE
ncbi:MAG: helix-turn-helix domain containing protein [Lachnospiraceae bacterium]|nr:helix-turn-helix domain containing protein [Lachnospiraceae bacterium]